MCVTTGGWKKMFKVSISQIDHCIYIVPLSEIPNNPTGFSYCESQDGRGSHIKNKDHDEWGKDTIPFWFLDVSVKRNPSNTKEFDHKSIFFEYVKRYYD